MNYNSLLLCGATYEFDQASTPELLFFENCSYFSKKMERPFAIRE